jgi:hypothetical protein
MRFTTGRKRFQPVVSSRAQKNSFYVWVITDNVYVIILQAVKGFVNRQNHHYA